MGLSFVHFDLLYGKVLGNELLGLLIKPLLHELELVTDRRVADLLALRDGFCQVRVLAGGNIACFPLVLLLPVSHVLDHQLILLDLFLKPLNDLVGLLQLGRGVQLVDLVDVDCGFHVLRLLPKVQRVYRFLVVAERLGNCADNCSL